MFKLIVVRIYCFWHKIRKFMEDLYLTLNLFNLLKRLLHCCSLWWQMWMDCQWPQWNQTILKWWWKNDREVNFLFFLNFILWKFVWTWNSVFQMEWEWQSLWWTMKEATTKKCEIPKRYFSVKDFNLKWSRNSWKFSNRNEIMQIIRLFRHNLEIKFVQKFTGVD